MASRTTRATPSAQTKKAAVSSNKSTVPTKRFLNKVIPSHYTPRIPSALGKPRVSLPSTASPLDCAAKHLRPRKVLQSKREGACNIQVAVRVRALTQLEEVKKESIVFSTDIASKTLKVTSEDKKTPATFQFDHVFGPETSQATVFDGIVEPMLEEVIKGFNCTILAYGQTGTGKTFTIEGNLGTNGIVLDADAGVIPRTLHKLFHQLGEDQTNFTVRMSMLELYNEEPNDLLSLKSSPQKLMLTNDAHNKLQISGIEEELIEDTAAGIALLQRGSAKRHTAFTKCNATSSRSHCIVTITLRLKGSTSTVREGKLHIVDLAGSEDTKVSGASNQRAREAGSINQSLLTLGRVISALAASSENESLHIPYRESKLTRILADSLGGSSKTCFIATVAPTQSCLDESISTLKYATKAMKVTNIPVVNKAIPPSLQVKELESENALLRQKLLGTSEKNPHSEINRLLREIQVEKDKLYESSGKRLAAECTLREAYAASEANLNSIATQLLLAAQGQTQVAQGLQKTLVCQSSDLDLMQIKLSTLSDLFNEFMEFFKSNLVSSTSSVDSSVLAVDTLFAETLFQKGHSFSVVTKFKEIIQRIMSKLASVSKPTPEVIPVAQTSLSETLQEKVTQCFEELQTISSQDQLPDITTWESFKSVISKLSVLYEELLCHSGKIQHDLTKCKENVNLFKNVNKQCQIALKSAKEYNDADIKNIKELDSMFLALRNDIGASGLTPAELFIEKIESKLSFITEEVFKYMSELAQLLASMKCNIQALPVQPALIDLPDSWKLVDPAVVCSEITHSH
ncbi:Kinesin- motor protein [Entomophthora muscae]|uniref:Kinesin- motor protein n=1 Tax=Entomophthora muscae TaxID=34485 RepID=A0ACC2SMI3_9FUNG|nr:Kinesin- motor protein [Entomophthora muscae]